MMPTVRLTDFMCVSYISFEDKVIWQTSQRVGTGELPHDPPRDLTTSFSEEAL